MYCIQTYSAVTRAAALTYIKSALHGRVEFNCALIEINRKLIKNYCKSSMNLAARRRAMALLTALMLIH